MGIATFNGDVISTDSYIVPQGNSTPRIVTYPRTIGGIIQESGVIEKNLILKCYMLPSAGAKRKDVENYFNQLNERIGNVEATLNLNGNDYIKANVKTINYDHDIVNNFIKYTIEFVLGEQNTGSVIRQLSCPNLVGFTRGRKMTFRSQMDDGSYKTFTFFHNFDNIRNLETTLNIKHSNQFGGYGKITKQGGFERITCQGWIIGPTINNRKNLEAYFYNILNGPLGRLGTLVIDGQQTINKAFLSDLNVEDSVNPSLRYTTTFLASLQC